MDISLINTGLAAGAALAAVPVILHLFMKQRPKRVVFPALRLIRERQKRSRKKLRVKNWLLLLARMALLALMALALARPRIVTQAAGGDQEVPTAVALVFDTSLSMEYKQPDKTRLDLAREQAGNILKKSHASSVVFVIDSADPVVPRGVSPATARKRIQSLTLRAVNRPLNAAVGQAYAAVTATDKPRREVYVLTDLARSAWDTDRPAEGLDKVAKDKSGVQTYVLRLTPKDVHNVSVVEARPTSDVITEGEPVEVRARVRCLGPAASRVAKLKIDGVIRGEQPVDLPAGGEAEVKFVIPKAGEDGALHQGEVRVTGPPDPLAFDDVRYFTFGVKPAVNVLVVSDLPQDAEYLLDAIDPRPLPPGTPRPFHAEGIRSTQFLDRAADLGKNYRCVFLNNVRALDDSAWEKLAAFVQGGGGLVVGLGRQCDPDNYASQTAAQILPAVPDSVPRLKEPTTFGAVKDYTHPLFKPYPREIPEMLGQVPVSRYWKVQAPEGARVLLEYADKAPALLERVFKGSKTGRVLLWTTPLSRRPETNSPDNWNEFPVPSLGWSFWFLMNQSVSYLTGTAEENLVFEAGRDVVLPLDPTRRYKNYVVEDPERKGSERLSPPAESDALVVVAPQQIGNWLVKASGTEGSGVVSGFSINPPVSETQFVPMDTTALDRIFGAAVKNKPTYALIDDPSQIDTVVITVRVGRELFPWIMMLIMVVVALEGVLANRFYREAGTVPGSGLGSGQRAAARQPA